MFIRVLSQWSGGRIYLGTVMILIWSISGRIAVHESETRVVLCPVCRDICESETGVVLCPVRKTFVSLKQEFCCVLFLETFVSLKQELCYVLFLETFVSLKQELCYVLLKRHLWVWNRSFVVSCLRDMFLNLGVVWVPQDKCCDVDATYGWICIKDWLGLYKVDTNKY